MAPDRSENQPPLKVVHVESHHCEHCGAVCPSCLRTDEGDPKPPCRGFRWMGQDMSGCEGCGRDIREHEGLDWAAPNTNPFNLNAERMVLPFEEAMQRIPLFAHYATPVNGGRPYRWEAVDSGRTGDTDGT